jgi:hypothetical protein
MPTIVSKLRRQIETAQRAQSVIPHTVPGAIEPHAFSRVPPVATAIFSLGDQLPDLFDKDGRLRRAPNAAPAGETISIEHAVAANSRVFRAGAHLLVRKDREAAAVGREGLVAMRREETSFRVIRPLHLSVLADDADVTAQSHPADVAAIEWNDAPNYAARIELPRSERVKVDPEILCGEILAAVALGIGRAVDQVLLAAIAGATPAPTAFTLAKAAAAGLSFEELRAIAGTSGAGAAVAQDGALRVAGVAAELSDATAGSLIGSFARAAVAIDDHIELHIQRLGRNGAMAATLHLGLLALVPSADFYWTAA